MFVTIFKGYSSFLYRDITLSVHPTRVLIFYGKRVINVFINFAVQVYVTKVKKKT